MKTFVAGYVFILIFDLSFSQNQGKEVLIDAEKPAIVK